MGVVKQLFSWISARRTRSHSGVPLPSLEGVSYASPSACTSGYTEQLCLWPVGRAVRCVSSHTSHSVSCNLKRERVTAVAAWTVCHGSCCLWLCVSSSVGPCTVHLPLPTAGRPGTSRTRDGTVYTIDGSRPWYSRRVDGVQCIVSYVCYQL